MLSKSASVFTSARFSISPLHSFIHSISIFPISYTPCRSYFDCVAKVYAKEGLAGFFRGFTPAMARSFPANATCFLGYEYTKAFLNKI